MKTITLKSLMLSLLLALPLSSVPMVAQGAVAMDFSSLVEQVADGVVRINVVSKVSDEELAIAQKAQVLQEFFGGRISQAVPTVEYSYGTGFFVSADGYILTNHHVVEGADKISITLKDRTELDATLVGSDESSDVAVLKVAGKKFPALTVAKGDNLKVGEPVLAIGSPFGFDYSASAGIVSAKSRNMSREASVPFIQTDVALNQGNSGGPLFNKKGEVVGVNSRIFSGTGGHMGLSFSIPIDMAMDIYEQIRTTGKVTRVYLGVSLQDVDRTLAEAYQLERPQGAIITRVSPDSPASKMGLQSGDVVLEFNGQAITQASDLLNWSNRGKPAQAFVLTYQRAGVRQRASGVFEQIPQDVSSSQNSDRIRLGLRLKELSSGENAMLSAFGVQGGIVITSVDITGVAGRSGLQIGDIIVNLNHVPTSNIHAFGRAVESLPKQGVVTMGIIRDGVPVILGLRIE